MRRILIAFLSVFILLPTLSTGASAEWVEDGIPVTIGPYEDTGGHTMPDGEGGMFIVYTVGNYSQANIYAQRIDRNGNRLWAEEGIEVCTEEQEQMVTGVCSDGAGGIIILMYDERAGNGDLYAQRLAGDGTRIWPKIGVMVCGHTSIQSWGKICEDGEGGAYVAWTDNRNGNNDIFIQRIDSDGARYYTAEGVAVITQSVSQSLAGIVNSRSPYGAWIAFSDRRAGAMDENVYLIRVWGSTGGSDYPDSEVNGYPICEATGNQEDVTIVSDGRGGAVLAWSDSRTGGWDIYGQHIEYTWGEEWGSDGSAICNEATGSQIDPVIAVDPSGYVLAVFKDFRSGSSDIYAQKMNGTGNPVWTADGVVVCNVEGESLIPEMISDDTGGLIAMWLDRRGLGDDIYAQRLNSSGTRLWGLGGAAVCTSSGDKYVYGLATDGEGGALFMFSDGRNYPDWNNYVQRIDRYGYWGYAAPTITSAEDVPGDQGGYVHLNFEASRLDLWPYEEIDNYSIWRAISAPAAMQMIEEGARLIEDPSELLPISMNGKETPLSSTDSPTVPDKVVRRELLGASTFYWEQIEASFPAEHLGTYGYTAETLFDFTPVSQGFHYFQVIANANYGAEYWISAPDSGWSEDNLAPEMPVNVIGLPEYGPPAVTIEWDPNTEEDLFGYRIYRSDLPQFIPGPATMIGETTDPTIHDDYSTWASAYYMISAVDIHGNESVFAEFGPGIVTGDDLPDAPNASYLAQNYPNPFNPVTTISFGLKAAGPVSLKIYDPAGRLVRVLVDESRAASTYNEVWNGLDDGGHNVSSGVYFYRLEAKDFNSTKKLVLLR